MDKDGNLYGTTISGGPNGSGTVYKLTPLETGWTQTILYGFSGRMDGGGPGGTLLLDKAGHIYGVTGYGGKGGQEFGGVISEITP